MHRTAWVKPSPSPQPRARPQSQPKAKGKANVPEQPKSRAVQLLESQASALRRSTATRTEKDPQGGCFCLARLHPLSPYTRLCTSCGLILCNLNRPHHSCPFCLSELMSSSDRMELVGKLETEIRETMEQEREEKEREDDEKRMAAGAFPTLAGMAQAPRTEQSPQARKVLSLDAKSKKVTVSSYSVPGPQRAKSETKKIEAEPTRVPCPPSLRVSDDGKGSGKASRWANPSEEAMAVYVP